jgi:sugar O-acyltransferase (sialic acid O-acetyltransferase NeuD family)
MLTNLSIIGSGGHARVVVESLNYSKDNFKISIFDENIAVSGKLLSQFSIQFLNNFLDLNECFHIAIGANDVRARLSLEAIKYNKKPLSIIHQLSTVSSSASIQEGVFVAANSIIASQSIIETGCIINHAAIIDHDCSVGEYSHIAPNATLGGGVNIGRQCLIGAGSVILPNVTIGDFSIIGAGSIVINDVPKGLIMAGNPAREIG